MLHDFLELILELIMLEFIINKLLFTLLFYYIDLLFNLSHGFEILLELVKRNRINGCIW